MLKKDNLKKDNYEAAKAAAGILSGNRSITDMEKDTQKEPGANARVNRFVLVIVTVIDLFLFFGYIGDYKQGNIGFGFMMTVNVFVIVSMAACFLTYFRKKDSAAFAYVSVAGYMIVYGMAVFGAQNDLVFIMVFPLTVLFILKYIFL